MATGEGKRKELGSLSDAVLCSEEAARGASGAGMGRTGRVSRRVL